MDICCFGGFQNWDLEMGCAISCDATEFGCRSRFQSAFDSYSVACEAFSEHRSLLIPIGVVADRL